MHPEVHKEIAAAVLVAVSNQVILSCRATFMRS